VSKQFLFQKSAAACLGFSLVAVPGTARHALIA
jgi:hypothetical protein